MVGKIDYSSVPTSAELDHNKHSMKYTVNKDFNSSGGFLIPKSLCALIGIGAILLAVLTGLLVFFLVPREQRPLPQSQALTKDQMSATTFPVGTKDHISPTTTPPLDLKRIDIPHVEEKDERLPRSISPVHYRLQIVPFLENATTAATETITLVANEETDEILFHLKDLKMDQESVTLTDEDSKSVGIKSQNYLEGEKYRIKLESPLEKNKIYHLDFAFSGRLLNDLRGFYRSEYTDVLTGKSKYLASTQFSPNDARRAFPCFDEPHFKANFSITIGRQTHMTSLSNMPLARPPLKFDGEDDWWWDSYQETPKMSTYLVAFIVSDLKTNISRGSSFLKMWAKEDLVQQSVQAEMIASPVLDFLKSYTNVSFPLPKMDVVAVPDFGFNAMENWGLITFRENALLYDSYMSPVTKIRDISIVFAHELVHQWFGNLVTPKWWDDLWLKEGFSTYFEYLAVNDLEPSWNIKEEFLPYEIQSAYKIDSLENALPLTADIKSNKQIREAFNKLPYSKGACVVRMMNNLLGDDNFRAGLQEFLRRYQFSNADRYDLYSVLSETVYNITVENTNITEEYNTTKKGAFPVSLELLKDFQTMKDIMDTWTLQSGFPVVTVQADRSNASSWNLKLFQKRFSFTANTNKGNESLWWIPISVATDLQFSAAPKVWMKKEPEILFDVKPAMTNIEPWFLLNINYAGYYIVNYDEYNWKTLLKPHILMSLPTLTRAQLISDSMDLARANLLDYHIPLTMIGNMALRDSRIMFIPTLMALDKLQYLSDMLLSTVAFGDFQTYVNVIFKNTFETVTLDAAENYEYITQRILAAVTEWSCRNFDSKCVHDSKERFANWINKGEPVARNIKKVVYCTALKFGGEGEWMFAYRKYQETRSPSEKHVLLEALGCTPHRWLLASYLDFIKPNSSIKLQDAALVFESVASNADGFRIAFDYLRENWVKLVKELGDGGFNILSRMVGQLSRYINKDYQLMELIEFRKSVMPNVGIAEAAFDNAIEEARSNILWMKRSYKPVAEWLKAYRINFRI